MSSLPVQLTGLGTLIDLCESIQCIPYLVTWKKNGKGIQTLLTKVFRDECNRLLTKVDENGIILGKNAYTLTILWDLKCLLTLLFWRFSKKKTFEL